MREIANAFSRQVYRLDRVLPGIVDAARNRLDDSRAGDGVEVVAAKSSEVGHALVASYRAGWYTAPPVLSRTLLEDASFLAWVALPDDISAQTERMMRGVLDLFRRQKAAGTQLPAHALQLLRETTGSAARQPPSFQDRLQQLDADETAKSGSPFWSSHRQHFKLATDYVHSNLMGPLFHDPRTRELLGFSSLAHGYQYFSLAAVSAARLAGRNDLVARFHAAYGRTVDIQRRRVSELTRR
jgi:hypothetical protein